MVQSADSGCQWGRLSPYIISPSPFAPPAMSRRRTYAIIVVAVVLAAVVDLLMHLIPDSPGAKPWLEHQFAGE